MGKPVGHHLETGRCAYCLRYHETLTLWFLDSWKEIQTEFLLVEVAATFARMKLKTGILD
jgi:hypothetical protein